MGGRGYTMGSSDPTPGSAANGASNAGPSTREAGFLSYYEICDKINGGWTAVFDEQTQSMYAYGDGQWVGYENKQTLAHRCNVINDLDLAGVMFWDTSLDDVSGNYCGEGEYPLISMFKTCLN